MSDFGTLMSSGSPHGSHGYCRPGPQSPGSITASTVFLERLRHVRVGIAVRDCDSRTMRSRAATRSMVPSAV
jgi:hypothetical protein